MDKETASENKEQQNVSGSANCLPMVHGKATDAMAEMRSKDLKKDSFLDTAQVVRNEVSLTLNGFGKLKGTIGIGMHKLLSVAVAKFTAEYHDGQKHDEDKYKVTIPLREYAALCGYDVEEHEMNTPEETKKEHQRADIALKNARDKINRDLGVLFAASISWKEKIKGEPTDYRDVHILSEKSIRKGIISMFFTPQMGNYLMQLPITQYPLVLLTIDERNPNAYSVGLKLSEHYFMKSNQKKGTANTLKVKTLVKCTSLQTQDKLAESRHSWESRIREPFENIMNSLVTCGLLESWKYKDSDNMLSAGYENWLNTGIVFYLKADIIANS